MTIRVTFLWVACEGGGVNGGRDLERLSNTTVRLASVYGQPCRGFSSVHTNLV